MRPRMSFAIPPADHLVDISSHASHDCFIIECLHISLLTFFDPRAPGVMQTREASNPVSKLIARSDSTHGITTPSFPRITHARLENIFRLHPRAPIIPIAVSQLTSIVSQPSPNAPPSPEPTPFWELNITTTPFPHATICPGFSSILNSSSGNTTSFHR